MFALFGRKISNLNELREVTQYALERGKKGQKYHVTKEIHLEECDFQQFTNDFFKDQSWITDKDGGSNRQGEILCIRVINKNSSESILVNNEGYTYPRYTAIENN